MSTSFKHHDLPATVPDSPARCIRTSEEDEHYEKEQTRQSTIDYLNSTKINTIALSLDEDMIPDDTSPDFNSEADGITLYYTPDVEDTMLIVTWPEGSNAGWDYMDTRDDDGAKHERLEISFDCEPEQGAAMTKLLTQLGDWLRKREAKAALEKID